MLSFLLLCSVAFDKPLTKISTKEKMIALTFDDGPNIKVTEAILQILKNNDVKATFFVVGKNIKKHPELLKNTAEAEHEIGNHSMTHPHLPKLSAAAIASEIKLTQQLIRKITGRAPVLFRAPFLKHNENVWKCLKKLTLTSVNAALYGDFKGKGELKQHAAKTVAKVKPGSIILLHERPVTLQFLDEFIKEIKKQGYRFVTVSELMAKK